MKVKQERENMSEAILCEQKFYFIITLLDKLIS